MFEKGISTLATTGIKKALKGVPGVGLALTSFSLLSSAVSAGQSHERSVRQTENLAEAVDATGFVGSFQMYAVVTMQGGLHVVHMLPGYNTQQRIDTFNANLGAMVRGGVTDLLTNKPFDTSTFGFPFPINCLDELMAYQPQIQEMNNANHIVS